MVYIFLHLFLGLYKYVDKFITTIFKKITWSYTIDIILSLDFFA